jgi:hypothetical protein
LEDRLRRISERGDIIRIMQRELTAAGIAHSPADRLIHEAAPAGGIVGRVVARGLLDELSGRQFLIVDGVDGRAHHFDIGGGENADPLSEAAIVRVLPSNAERRIADEIIVEVSALNGGRYSAEMHLRHNPDVGAEFVQAHVRRLEALHRAGAGIERLGDGTWLLGEDYLEKAANHEHRGMQNSRMRIEVLSPLPLEQLATRDGATWLDQQLVGEEREPLRDSGFGGQARSALALRRQWLLKQNLAAEIDGEFTVRPGAIAALRQREISAVAAQLAAELPIPYAPAEEGERISGRLARRIDLASGRFVLIENSREFTLVPWRPMLERHIGREVSGIVRDDKVGWSIGRGRSGPSIS